jgi:hypothetical protein
VISVILHGSEDLGNNIYPKTEQVYVFTKQKCCTRYLTFLMISVSLNGTGTVGGFLSTLMPSFGGSKIFGFKTLALTCSLEDKHTFQYFFLVCRQLVCM